MHDHLAAHPAYLPEFVEALRELPHGEGFAESLEHALTGAPPFELPVTPISVWDYLTALAEVFGPEDEDHELCEEVFCDRWESFWTGFELATAIAGYRSGAGEQTQGSF